MEAIPPQHAQLIHKLIEETTNEMKEIIHERNDLKSVERWLRVKTQYLYQTLKRQTIKPATHGYVTIKQIGDAAAHFTAEYRASKLYRATE